MEPRWYSQEQAWAHTQGQLQWYRSMEEAGEMKHLERAYENGLRAIGPTHYGPGVYANGTDSSDRLNTRGVELLKTMEIYKGAIWASYNNCRKFVNHNRQFSDEMITELINRQRGQVTGSSC